MVKNKKETLKQKRKQVREAVDTLTIGFKMIGIFLIAIIGIALAIVIVKFLSRVLIGQIVLAIMAVLIGAYFVGVVAKDFKRKPALGPPSEFESKYFDRVDKESKKSSKANKSKRNT